MEVGQRIKERRNELGMTQDQVAEYLGITRQTISNWENGKSYPDIERIIRLSELYTLSLDELLKGDQTMVNHLKEATEVNRFLKHFSVLMIVNIVLMGLLLVLNTSNGLITGSMMGLISLNTLSIFYLIIKKI
ncbi:helix-turn-helix domain-containing protein [Marinilactibacillus kalidii]|uniref:helix-turn-helix domain-containing protein n=1 Tax=Marinilactibacillus kalidii TaxID=2820274 RepID=UPI001ABDD1CF|nr:helix-turn-helix transcriptional regulator [Marinilactibacillus kalidii]